MLYNSYSILANDRNRGEWERRWGECGNGTWIVWAGGRETFWTAMISKFPSPGVIVVGSRGADVFRKDDEGRLPVHPLGQGPIPAALTRNDVDVGGGLEVEDRRGFLHACLMLRLLLLEDLHGVEEVMDAFVTPPQYVGGGGVLWIILHRLGGLDWAGRHGIVRHGSRLAALALCHDPGVG